MAVKMESADEGWRDYFMKLHDGQKPRDIDTKTIMNTASEVMKPPEGKITDYIKKHDGDNSSGAIKKHLDILDKLLKKGGNPMSSLKDMLGSSGMNSANEAANSQQQNQCPPGQRWDQTQQKCVIDCPQGQIWDPTSNTCIIDDSSSPDMATMPSA